LFAGFTLELKRSRFVVSFFAVVRVQTRLRQMAPISIFFPCADAREKFTGGSNGGLHDGDELELRAILGLWKPRNGPVYDTPLVCVDASTVRQADIVPQEQSFTHIVNGQTMEVSNLAATPRYSPRHRWFYYPAQTKTEITVFRHNTPGDFSFANIHGAVDLPLPNGASPRQSVETRAYLYYELG